MPVRRPRAGILFVGVICILFVSASGTSAHRVTPTVPVDCNAVTMHLDYSHHLVIEPVCRWV